MSLPPQTRIGRVDINVRDVDKARMFYEKVLGLRTIARRDGVVELGGDEPIVGLHAAPDAPPRPPRAPGLYHMAILLPSRGALGGFLQHAHELWPIDGASDHLVSEALYLSDPEENGIEVYADRPRAAWRWQGDALQMATQPMDVEGVLSEAEAWRGAPGATTMGHVHLQVSDVPAAERFYRDLVGFDLTARYGDQASFLSAGRYHHHLAVNSWMSRGAPTPPEGSLGLRSFTVRLPDAASRDEAAKRVGGTTVRDPSGNVVVLE